MPFKSQAQRAFMFIHHPKIAKEFEASTVNKKLPYKLHKAYDGLIKEQK